MLRTATRLIYLWAFVVVCAAVFLVFALHFHLTWEICVNSALLGVAATNLLHHSLLVSRETEG